MKLSDAQKIKAARALLDWTQKDLAAQSGVSHSTICMLETGKHKTTNANRIALFRALMVAGIGITDYGVFIKSPTDQPVPESVKTSRAADLVGEPPQPELTHE